MSATKKTGSRGSKRRTTTKRTTAHSKTKKGSKVYIPAYKTIILCLSVIILCLVLLLVNTLPKTQTKTEPQEASITERFEEDSKKQETEKLASPEIKLDDKKSGTKTPQKKEEQKSKQESVKT